MQLTFGNMTLELNIFHLYKKHIHPEEGEGPKEVCMIDTSFVFYLFILDFMELVK